MIINKFLYLVLESFRSIRRTLIPSFVSSITIAISLIVLSISYFLYTELKDYTYDLKDDYKIDVFFNNDLDLSTALSVFNEILLIDGIEEGSFIDKETAASIFKQEFNEDIVKIIGVNPLPMGGAFGISKESRAFSNMKNITSQINSMPNVDQAMFAKDSILKFDEISRNILSFSFLIGLFIMFIAVFVVSNTILLVVLSREKEIKTLELLGASQIFIKFPYILEGIILGLFGSFFSILSLYGLYKISFYIVATYYSIPSFPYNHIILLNVSLGILLGLLGSSKSLSSNIFK